MPLEVEDKVYLFSFLILLVVGHYEWDNSLEVDDNALRGLRWVETN